MDDTVDALTAPLPGTHPKACAHCHGFIHEVERWGVACENCDENAVALGMPPVSITPISLYQRQGRMRDWLTCYKPDLEHEHGETTVEAADASAVLAGIVSVFFGVNSWLLRDVDTVVVVPSTRRDPPHPLETVIARTRAPLPPLARALTRTVEPLDHRRARPAAFLANAALEGQRVLLVDDVYASGARLQSAAAALQIAGAHVAGAVVLGRRVNPEFHPEHAAMWLEARTRGFTWERSA